MLLRIHLGPVRKQKKQLFYLREQANNTENIGSFSVKSQCSQLNYVDAAVPSSHLIFQISPSLSIAVFPS